MSHPTATPDAVVEAYVATWNETDPVRRRAGLAAAWTETGIYRDPVMASDGPAGDCTINRESRKGPQRRGLR